LSEDLRAKIKRFVEEVSRDWGVNPPEVVLQRIEEFPLYRAYYNWVDKVLIVDPRGASFRVILHELAHHIQNELKLIDRATVERELAKPHCQRSYEVEAKVFERAYREFYGRLWREITGIEEWVEITG
jgi:hypothetical protein